MAAGWCDQSVSCHGSGGRGGKRGILPITTNAIEGWPQGPDTYSETAVLMDADTGTILYNKGMDEKRYPAEYHKDHDGTSGTGKQQSG